MKHLVGVWNAALLCAAALACPVVADARQDPATDARSENPAATDVRDDPAIGTIPREAADMENDPAAVEPPDDAGEASDETDELELISIDREPEQDDSDIDELEEFEDELTVAPSPRESSLEELRRSFDLYKQALSIGSYDEADTLAKRMVELAIRIYGLDSHESAKALTNLGLVQQKNHEYEAAILNFEAAIGIIERIEDRLNSNLINPLRGLGAAQMGAGRPDLALKAYNRAVHTSHVNEGPHNQMQIEILEELAEVYLAMGDRDEALDMHQAIYNLEARNTDLKSEEIIPALNRQAEWLNRMRLHEKERMTYRQIIRILEDTRGRDDLSLIEPLTGIGRSYMFISEFDAEYYGETSVTSGDTYLKRALRIAEENPDTNWQVRKDAMLALADYYVLTQRASKAKNVYEDTWNLLSEDEERMLVRSESLERPVLLNPVNPPKYFDSDRPDDGSAPPDSFEVGIIVVGYQISNRGVAEDVAVLSADPPGLEDMEYSVARELKHIVYRPRMENGTTVDTPDQIYRHEFYYRPSDLPTTEDPAVEDESVAGTGES